MKLYHYIVFKRITALFLLGLIVFTYAVKVFHTHAHDSGAHNTPNEATFKSVCAICDYHFVKDAEDYISFINIKSPISYYQFNVKDIFTISFTTSETTLLRGPPALI